MDSTAKLETSQIPVTEEVAVTGVLAVPQWWPTGSRVGVALAHDAQSSSDADLVAALQHSLSERGCLSMRFNFPFAEQGKKRPDPEPLLERAFRAAIAFMLRDPQNAPSRLILGGVGLGARVAAQVVAGGLKADGLLLLSFPLHPPGKPGQQRVDALFRIICPVLFMQGTHDTSCRIDRLQLLLRRIGAPTELHVVQDADHDLMPVRRSERTPESLRAEVVKTVEQFVFRVTGGP
jgi:predicted alpha/beta-hydrolase family hydrolase